MLPYQDSCVIKGKEVVDSITGKTSYSSIYNGACDYQASTSNIVNGVTMAQGPRLYIPYDGLLDLELNQSIDITLSIGRIIKATILNFQYINFGKAKGIKINLNETTY